MSRGWQARAVAAAALAGAMKLAAAATGSAVPELAAFDNELQAFMQRWQVPGAALAVARQGRLVLARGHGVVDRSTGEALQPDALFRIASVGKAVTATAAMQLIGLGLLSPDLPVFPNLARGVPSDPRLDRITVRHLLQHSGGWDSEQTFDPIAEPARVAAAMGVASPPDTDTLLRWLLQQPLQFEPGTREASSNVGYVLLGEVLARATGQRYEDQVRTMLLATGTTGMRVGASLPAGRLAREVVYHMPPGTPLVPSAFSSVPGLVPAPYGGFAVELAAAAAGWVASAIDLVAFAAALDGDARRPELLSPAALAETMRKPSYAPPGAAAWYGLGWHVLASGDRLAHGNAPGMGSLLVVAADGTAWAALLNLGALTDEGMIDDLDRSLRRAHAATTTWPTGDAFAALHDQGPIDGCYGRPLLLSTWLCLPQVDVPGSGAYTATLQLVDPATYTFALGSARPALGVSDAMATYDDAQGLLTLPRVLLPAAGGPPAAYRARLGRVPAAPGLQLRLLDAEPLSR